MGQVRMQCEAHREKIFMQVNKALNMRFLSSFEKEWLC